MCVEVEGFLFLLTIKIETLFRLRRYDIQSSGREFMFGKDLLAKSHASVVPNVGQENLFFRFSLLTIFIASAIHLQVVFHFA